MADEKVSRRHARISYKEGKLYLEDLNSANGSFVNSVKTAQAYLKTSDVVQFGSHVFRVEQGSAGQSTSFGEEPTVERSLADITHDPLLALFSALAELMQVDLSLPMVMSQSAGHVAHFLKADHVQIEWHVTREIKAAASSDKGKQTLEEELPEAWKKKALLGQQLFSEGHFNTYVFPLAYKNENKGTFWIRFKKESVEHQKISMPILADVKNNVLGLMIKAKQETDIKNLTASIFKFKTYVSNDVFNAVLRSEAEINKSSTNVEEKFATVLFCDIQGFTSMSERLSAKEISEILNAYFKVMVEAIREHKGEVNKFIGDAIMAVFGAPISHGNDALNAVNAAMKMLEALNEFWKTVSEANRFNIRIGINSGKMVAGNIGSPDRMEYTVLGDEVNVASRLEGWSKPNTITLGQNTARLVKDHVTFEKIDDVSLKGKSGKISVYRVLGKIK